MLIWLVNLIFDVVNFVFGIALWILPIFIIAKLIFPQNKYVLLCEKYVNLGLFPLRSWLRRAFPKLFMTGIDFSPVVLWLLIRVGQWLLSVLKHILL